VRVNEYPRISIIRGGLDEHAHLNIEVWRALFQAEIIFHAGCSSEVARWLDDFVNAADIVDLGIGVDFMGPYQPDLYRATAIQIIVAAQELQGEVVLVEPRRTQVANLVTPFVIRAADNLRVPVRVIPVSPASNGASSGTQPIHRRRS
jgi:hypothetical protein